MVFVRFSLILIYMLNYEFSDMVSELFANFLPLSLKR